MRPQIAVLQTVFMWKSIVFTTSSLNFVVHWELNEIGFMLFLCGFRVFTDAKRFFSDAFVLLPVFEAHFQAGINFKLVILGQCGDTDEFLLLFVSSFL